MDSQWTNTAATIARANKPLRHFIFTVQSLYFIQESAVVLLQSRTWWPIAPSTTGRRGQRPTGVFESEPNRGFNISFSPNAIAFIAFILFPCDVNAPEGQPRNYTLGPFDRLPAGAWISRFFLASRQYFFFPLLLRTLLWGSFEILRISTSVRPPAAEEAERWDWKCILFGP